MGPLKLDLALIPRNKGERLAWHLTAEGRLFLDLIQVPRTRRGAGSVLLAAFLSVADKHGLVVELVADPTDRVVDPGTGTLVRWYSRHGFVVIGTDAGTQSPRMLRPAAAPAS